MTYPIEQIFDAYKSLLGMEIIDELFALAKPLKGLRILHVNSTKEGGGVAEILSKMVPLTNALQIQASWEVIQGNPRFFQCTKMFHNLLQSQTGSQPDPYLLKTYEEVNASNAKKLDRCLREADVVFIHDPQPLPLRSYLSDQRGVWFWRCHIDLSAPSKPVWDYLKQFVENYDATIFSLADFAKPLSHPVYIIPPSIDPFSEKNIDLTPNEIQESFHRFKIDKRRPILLQVSRFDRFKDPLGVIQSYRIAKEKYPDIQLVLVGSGATDDPEGEAVLQEVKYASKDDPDIHILLLPPDSHRLVNALQRGADIILQKSLKEGFGLTVTEALWKKKPMIAGNTGGIRLQVIDQQTGSLVNSPEEAADRISYLIENPEIAKQQGINGKKLVQEKFLITRHLKDYLNAISMNL